jgi:hypothetical protein
MDILVEQKACFLPVSLDGSGTDVERRCRFFNGQVSEKTAFDDLYKPLVVTGQAFQGIMERQQVGYFLVGYQRYLFERNSDEVAAAFLGALPPGIIDQDESHGSRRYREKMDAVLPVNAALVDQLEIGFVDERRGVERFSGSLVDAAMMGETMKFLINHREKLVHNVALPYATVEE